MGLESGSNASSEIATVRQDTSGDVTLTLRKGTFSQFLAAFLGPQETLTKSFYKDFAVKWEDVLQFHYLLIQKTEKEQFISLALAAATIHYDDNSSRTITGIESIERYAEHRDVGVVSLNVAWQLVFRAPDRGDVQQQRVSVLFETRGSPKNDGLITITVEHTNQVWAAEVVRLFEEHINKIVTHYATVFRLLSRATRTTLLDYAYKGCVVAILLGGAFIWLERVAFLGPVTVKQEFLYDVIGAATKDPPSRDLDSFLQFFLIRDLDKENSTVITDLQRKGYFNSRYDDVIQKLSDNYYDGNKKSDRLDWTRETEIAKRNAKHNVAVAWRYLKVAIAYLCIYFLAYAYVWLFKMSSIVAVTSKGIRQIAKQERDKSSLVQFGFGVTASLLAAGIYACGQWFFAA